MKGLRTAAEALRSLPYRRLLAYALFVGASQCLPLLTGQRLSRLQTVEAAGLHALLLSYVGVGVVLTTFGSPTALVRQLSRRQATDHGSYLSATLALVVLMSGLVGSVLSRMPSGIAGLFFSQQALPSALRELVHAYLVCFSVEVVLIAALTAYQEYTRLAGLAVCRTAATAGWLFSCQVSIEDIWWSLLAGSVFFIAGALHFLIRNRLLSIACLNIKALHQLGNDSWPFLVGSLMVSPALYGLYRLGAAEPLGLERVGYFAICRQWANWSSTLANQFNQALFPRLNAVYSGGESARFEKLRRDSFLVGQLLAVAGCTVTLLAFPVLFPLYGWPVTRANLLVFVLTLAGSSAAVLNQFYGNLVIIEGQARIRMQADMLYAFALVGSGWLLLKLVPVYSLALANLLSLLTAVSYVYYRYRKEEGETLTRYAP